MGTDIVFGPGPSQGMPVAPAVGVPTPKQRVQESKEQALEAAAPPAPPTEGP